MTVTPSRVIRHRSDATTILSVPGRSQPPSLAAIGPLTTDPSGAFACRIHPSHASPPDETERMMRALPRRSHSPDRTRRAMASGDRPALRACRVEMTPACNDAMSTARRSRALPRVMRLTLPHGTVPPLSLSTGRFFRHIWGLSPLICRKNGPTSPCGR